MRAIARYTEKGSKEVTRIVQASGIERFTAITDLKPKVLRKRRHHDRSEPVDKATDKQYQHGV